MKKSNNSFIGQYLKNPFIGVLFDFLKSKSDLQLLQHNVLFAVATVVGVS